MPVISGRGCTGSGRESSGWVALVLIVLRKASDYLASLIFESGSVKVGKAVSKSILIRIFEGLSLMITEKGRS